jgi:hypothetical protein
LAQYKRSSKGKSRKIHSLDTKVPIVLESLKYEARNDWLSDTSLRFQNEPWQINVPGTPSLIVLSDPATIEDGMVNKSDIFGIGVALQDVMHDLLGGAISNVDGEQWFRQRKTAAKFFTARTLRMCMTHTMQRNIEQVHQYLNAYCGTV